MAATIGILGGGQLGALLGQAALSLNHKPLVMVQNLDESAVSWGLPHELHSYYNPQGIRNFLDRVDLVLFENEFFPPALQELAQGFEHKFRPSLKTLLKLQNKATQKKLFEDFKIPTAPFEVFKGQATEISEWLQSLETTGKAYVLKWAFGGYDGKGVLKFQNAASALEFCQAGLKKGAQIYAEDFVPYSMELAMVGARNSRGEFCHYPLVCSKQENSICKWVTGPATGFGITRDLENQAARILQNFATHAELVGSFAVEFFLSPKAELLVNEVAPRVHNSGHYTLQACNISQFALHIQACMGETLTAPTCTPFFGMLNLIGNTYLSRPEAPSMSGNHTLYWYDKKDLKKLRKMGHINTVAQQAHELETKLQELKALDDRWLMANLSKVKHK